MSVRCDDQFTMTADLCNDEGILYLHTIPYSMGDFEPSTRTFERLKFKLSETISSYSIFPRSLVLEMEFSTKLNPFAGDKVAENFYLHSPDKPKLWEQYAFSGNHSLIFTVSAERKFSLKGVQLGTNKFFKQGKILQSGRGVNSILITILRFNHLPE